jgi:hypothetical protein
MLGHVVNAALLQHHQATAHCSAQGMVMLSQVLDGADLTAHLSTVHH